MPVFVISTLPDPRLRGLAALDCRRAAGASRSAGSCRSSPMRPCRSRPMRAMPARRCWICSTSRSSPCSAPKGCRERRIIFQHVLRNSAIPMVTIFLPMFVGIATGSIFVEAMFRVPGLGAYFVSSIDKRDYPLEMALMLLISAHVLHLLPHRRHPLRRAQSAHPHRREAADDRNRRRRRVHARASPTPSGSAARSISPGAASPPTRRRSAPASCCSSSS